MSLKRNILASYATQIYVTLVGIPHPARSHIRGRCGSGALSLIKRNCQAFDIYAGNPVRRIKERKRDLLELEQRFRAGKA